MRDILLVHCFFLASACPLIASISLQSSNEIDVSQFLLPDERLIWSRAAGWNERLLSKVVAGIAIFSFLWIAGLSIFLSLTGRASEALIIVLLVFVLFCSLVFKFFGELLPETCAITSKRVIIASYAIGSICIKSTLLSEVSDFVAHTRLATTGVQFRTRSRSKGCSALSEVIACPASLIPELLRVASEALSEASSAASVAPAIPVAPAASLSVSILPEKLQRELEGEAVHFASAEPLRRLSSVTVGAAARVFAAIAIAFVIALPWFPFHRTGSPTSLSAVPSFPPAVEPLAQVYSVLICAVGLTIGSLVILRTGIAGNGYIVATGTHILSARTLFRGSFVVALATLSHRDFAFTSTLYVPSPRTCAPNTSSLYVGPKYGRAIVPVRNAPQLYQWILGQAEASPRPDATDLVL